MKIKNNKEYIGLVIIPVEFLLGIIIGKISVLKSNIWAGTCVNVGIFVIGFLLAVFLFKDFLKGEWIKYKADKLWLKLFVNVLLAIGIYGILALIRSIGNGNLSINDPNISNNSDAMLMLIGSIQPFLAPFVEEITFRYLLLGKISNKYLKVIMFFVSSILFGLIHINNFSGEWIRTIPYMIIGLYFAFIYYCSKNIWSSIIVHWIFNSINSIIPAIIILIFKLISVI